MKLFFLNRFCNVSRPTPFGPALSKQAVYLVLCLMFGLASPTALALDRARHVIPTQNAAWIYNQCLEALKLESRPILATELAALLAGVESMDDASLRRGWNWHFYDAEKPEERVMKRLFPLMIRRSLHHDFGRLHQQLEVELLGQNRFFESVKIAAEILHYLQDMAVPAHVAPIYHGPGKADNFDSYRMSTRLPAVTLAELGGCNSLSENTDHAEQLLHRVAAGTRAAIESEFLFPKGQRATWEIFWRLWPNNPASAKPKQGFSTYGECGPNFGVGGLSVNSSEVVAARLGQQVCNTVGDEEFCYGKEMPEYCRLPVKTFDDFYYERYKTMVKVGVQLLIYVAQKSTERPL